MYLDIFALVQVFPIFFRNSTTQLCSKNICNPIMFISLEGTDSRSSNWDLLCHNYQAVIDQCGIRLKIILGSKLGITEAGKGEPLKNFDHIF
ncbi:hypothetical protein DPEC_G00145610 [Dallia pectoralis]|uniref:Uncharacterized protein n=1 Tax=Dallia pectoralis TaxID=75939 RepID=A0ACC2GP49_DALPE|nr:hypothetical protein DPEC_G00145610 [Dallia pectoralis]